MADAPKLLGTDTLRQAYPKFNQAIDNANEALGTANTAKSTADNAVTTANAANAKSDDTQQQLNNIVINNGQSDAEVLQARGTFAVLNDRLNDADSQLADVLKDTTDLQTTINDFANRNVKLTLKRKIYEVTASLLIPSNVEVDFNHSTIKRKTGAGVFDLIKNADTVNGNTDIKLYNLKIDGNKDADLLVATTESHRFGGLTLFKVTNSTLKNIEVTGTVNNENTAGIYFEDCSGVDAYNLDGYSNDRTAILLVRSKVRINGSITYDNLGSGISSIDADESEYHNIVTYNNGYSNLSINGERSKASNILTYGSSYSGLNIGHSTAGNNSDDTIVTNVHSYNNGYEGITIAGSKGVKLIGFEVHGNTRNNVRVYDGASDTKLLSFTVRDSAGGQGMLYESGLNHLVNDADIYGNAASGIYVSAGVSIKVGDLVNVYNNGIVNTANSGGIVLNGALDSYIGDVNIFDNQTTKTQETGLWIAGGSGHKIKNPTIKDNKTYGYRETNAPTGVKYADRFTSLAGTQLNGWTGSGTAKTGYYKDSDGFVHLVGLFNSGTIATAAFNLPVGYRPATNQNFATVANNVFALCVVTSTGDVVLYTSNTNHYVNNVIFKAEL
jgi:Alanine-zipper, major outer membrane lipoprotein